MDEQKAGKWKSPVIVTIVSIVLLAVLLAVGGWAYFQAKLDKINYVPPAPPAVGEVVAPDVDPGHFNLLIMGTDERSKSFNIDARSDCTMILSLDLEKHTARVVSLERGIGVPVEDRDDDWLTHVFAYGGANMMMRTVREQFDVSLDGYVRVNFYAFEQIINAIGGVDITLTETEAAALNGEIHTNATTKHRVKVGLNHLDGFDALQYARERFIDDDWHRIARQRTVMQAAIEQTKHLTLLQMDSLLNKTLPLVQTNLSKKQISALLPYAPFFLGVQLKQMSLPLPGTFGSYNSEDGRSLMLLDFAENSRVLDAFLYDSFDPATYTAPKKVTDDIYAEQRKRAQAWAIAHPEPISSESSEDELLPEDGAASDESFDPDDERDDTARSKAKPKARSEADTQDTSSRESSSSRGNSSSRESASSKKESASASSSKSVASSGASSARETPE